MARIQRKQAVNIGSVMKSFLRAYKLTPQLNRQRIFECWESVSGAGRFTGKLFFRDGVLYVTLTSSVVRSQLIFQKDALLEKMNALLSDDILFDSEEPATGYLKDLRIK